MGCLRFTRNFPSFKEGCDALRKMQRYLSQGKRGRSYNGFHLTAHKPEMRRAVRHCSQAYLLQDGDRIIPRHCLLYSTHV